ncbi:MAG: 4-(cytidine 5'-diphospho)-2-C-methyl-D-erythritol kinase [Meiothermus sp.]|uniref:4-(cytidine 5'-diphospho)-2-C-methyl-D-erythritol kinase n=1 Tax=Meiothermus sp. TaxID=1955249 RepID=UPI0025DC0665|nr:4-(cytidine 5'-diphospho)-2-C-methyl-D-erythritol kinase [Meiothermus sp.]MCS7057874.1 4-(cytidine 5'-diphospho)-2-C-methyl-D-erythritol kinase [Meiothermus sp.]MCS7194250.1 4-(cytidine 5'-diphospho)-2-C-methyl-D-erythritol kinase [Meiothermus sp.]MCX7739528.1 4-(cytidine 5'-diphospho)-2-C-methyl-D-erythritol kinase [Meiothermus sp.]MDW8090816.1 4-(cytidine 5'-diphospho)-2-C-methyl-D-erythritol kinase [Meiothermus sp.]MDW8480762.1 4-(cytidine 5'-diphospho)-2-C-methyl-D-erythritol kinase [Me
MELLAPAKVNLGLSILRRRNDGYHELHTLFATVGVADRLSVEPLPKGVELETRGAKLPAPAENLVYKAALAYLEAAGWPGGVRIVLEKHLPVAAGLGGGSSDAAATLRALARLYPCGLDLFPLALRLGADVPFFLLGGLAEGRGVGERLTPLPPLKAHLVLVNPGIAISAAEAYRNLTPSDWREELDTATLLEALRSGEEPPYWNSLEGPVFRLYPFLEALKRALYRAGLRGVLLSGSGSTLFGLAEDEDQAQSIAQRLRLQHPGFWVAATQTVS